MSLEWIANVPESWTISESQFVLNFQKREVLETDEIVTAFRDGQVTLRSNRRTDGFTMAEKEIGYQHICEGDLVIHSMDGGFGAIGVSDACGKASPVVHAYTSTRCDLRFVAYQLRAAVNSGWVAAQAKGIRVRSTQFDRPALASFKIAYPALETQQRIADYLDREAAEIDAAVADLDKYVELLKRRRGIAIVEALNKPSGKTVIDFEESNQKIRRVGLWYYAEVNPVTRGFQDLAAGEQVSFLPLECIWPDKQADYSQKKIWNNAGTSYTQFQYGDVLVPKVTPTVFHGRSMIAETETSLGLATSEVHVLRPKVNVDPRWLVYNLLSSRFLDRAKGEVFGVGGLQRISAGYLASYKVIETELEIQTRIADHLDEEISGINSLIADSTKLRDLLLKRRSVLISDVVTGRKQV